MSNRLLLIDGHSIINRAFYGIRDLTNSEGFHTNAIYGFLNIFFSVYSKYEPDHILVAFDVNKNTFRHEMYKEYKGNRKPMPQELHEQVPVLKDVLHAMKIRTVELPGYEADDIIGTYARKAEHSGMETIILSGDRDLLQLATEKTMICLPRTKAGKTEYEEYYADQVQEKYNVTPTEFIDLKALMGDTSDNIPGIPGIGEKTASAIISKYKSLEAAIEHAAEIKPRKASENLIEFSELGRMSKVLATINTDSPVTVPIEDGITESEKVFYNPQSYELYKKLELNRLLSRFEAQDSSDAGNIEYTVQALDDFDPDTLTEDQYGLYVSSDLRFVSLCGKDRKAIVYAGHNDEMKQKNVSGQMSFDFNSNDEQYSQDSSIITSGRIESLLRSGKELYVFGLKDLLHSLNITDFRSDNIYDIEIMAYLLNPLQSSYSYDMIAKDYLDMILPSEEDLTGKKATAKADKEGTDIHSNFEMRSACSSMTAAASFQLIKDKLEEEEMWDLFMTIENPLIYSLYYMELIGIQTDKERLAEFSTQLAQIAGSLEKEIYEEAGEEFNINSPIQLGNILFEKMGLPASKKTKKGYSTSADILEKLAPDFPIVSKILRYRQVTKLKSTYADGLVNFIGPDGRIHGTFNQTITATGRISSTEPNLQNIPVRMELGQEIRRAFTARKGCIFLDADYSQIELRLLAHMSGDENLIEAYNTEADIHRITASKVFHIPYEDVTKEQRRNAKAVNFGIVYGISSFGLSQDLSITRKQAADYIRQYFETYPGIKKYLDNTVKKAKIDGYVTSMFGRKRPIPELASANFMQRSFGERAAMNSPLQGSAADIIKIAMIHVDRALEEAGLRSRIVLQVHDELLVETWLEEEEQVRAILYEQMKNAASLSVPLEVDVERGQDWLEAH